MRTAIISLLAAGLATSAAAQTAAPVAPTAPTPDAAAAPAAPMAPAAAPAVAPAPEPEKVYAIPTTGEIGQIIDVINRICVPLVRGGDISKLATKDMGFKFNRRDATYTQTLQAKPYTLTVFAPGSNKDVCRIALNYTLAGEKPIIVGLNIFSLLHQPELLQQRNDYVPATDYKRITNSWEYFTDHESIGLVFLQLKKPDGSSVNAKWDMGEVLYSERKF
ncbi:MAG: hypothetical protein KA085_10780 [Phenylobacterium sp.]|uniref:hypothetical protein n=1 Tax=Phenylobacterium sp. TaxID=1871053 RepID=UPI001B6B46BE|nr:hypothetical protein [Phenylobacterium sp.]MBP7816602.1 hypothetical protein [Phenylobacterium sp.]MBP9229989.1 hypothetical protein [Phenylobacterium sp.]MBP9755189.1 hypothetical protein [Phenylobacterium sp.]